MTLKTKIMNVISEQLDQMFTDHFGGKCVAVTFSGSIILIEDDMVTVLKKLQGLKMEPFFVHEIGGERHV